MKTIPPLATRRRAGFTLIEMLVVIAVMALLISIIVPSVNRSIESSRSAVCMNNLRQVGVAILAYTTDHRGRLPPTGFYGVSPHYNRDPRNFPNSLLDYLDLKPSDTWSTNPQLTEFAPIFACPSFKGPIHDKPYRLVQRVDDEYGNSLRPWGFISNAQGSQNPPPELLSMFPPQEVAMLDTEHQGRLSHRNYRNALHFDFHVSRVRVEAE